MRIFIRVVAAVILMLSAMAAQAYDSAGNANSTRVRFAVKFDDLNLDREHDAQIMLKRIERAASKACGGHAAFSTYTGGLEPGFYECRNEAIRQAVKQLQAPRVGQLYKEMLKQEFERQP